MAAHAVLARSPLASYSFKNTKGANIRVCYQDKSGNIGQTFYDDQKGWHPGTQGSPGRADLNNGMAITGWDDGAQERVYCLGTDRKIIERCHSADRSDWFDGELTGKFTAAHYSQLAAISYQVGELFRIRVYYQDADGAIREACRDGTDPWYDGHKFPVAIQGTSIACSYIPGKNNYIWLFYQKPNTQFVEYLMQDSSTWKEGVFKSQLVYDPGAYITCASYGKDDHRVFTVDRDNELAVTEFNTGSNNWGASKKLTGVIPFSPAAAVPVPGNEPWVRVYTQKNPSEITEWGTNDGKTYQQMANKLPTN